MIDQLEIVVIDDERADRALTCLVLRHEFSDANVVELSKPIELVEYLSYPRCDVAVVDRDLSWGEGYRLLFTLRERFPECRLILTGSGPLAHYGAQESALGLDGYIVKRAPGMLELAPAIRAALRNSASRSELPRVGSSPRSSGSQVESTYPVAGGAMGWHAAEATNTVQEFLREIAERLSMLGQGSAQSEATDQRAEFEGIERTALRALSILDGLTTSEAGRVSRTEPVETVDLDRAVDLAMANLASEIAEGNAQIHRVEMPSFLADRNLLSPLFEILLGNALRFAGSRRPDVYIGATELPDAWRIEVTDNGVGIESEDYGRVFGSPEDGAAGETVGLAGCKRIVRLLGGDIWVSSIPDVGSTFYFTLPKQKPADSSLDSNVTNMDLYMNADRRRGQDRRRKSGRG